MHHKFKRNRAYLERRINENFVENILNPAQNARFIGKELWHWLLAALL